MSLSIRAVAFAILLLPIALVSTSCASTSSATAMSLPAAGTPAPAFSAADQTGAVRTLESFHGKPLVLFFYPKDGSPGCTKEACAFRDAWQRYEAANVAVVGVSTDSVASHAAFAAEHRLPFALLADTDEQMLRAYGVKSMLGMAQRVTILIDGNGIVSRTFPDVDPGVHADEHRRAYRPERDR